MYILARGDISHGLQAAQSVHAAFLLSMRDPDVVDAWLKGSSTIVLLQVASEDHLLEWADSCYKNGVPYLLVTEPDLGGEHTALIVPPNSFNKNFSNLPLQGKNWDDMVLT